MKERHQKVLWDTVQESRGHNPDIRASVCATLLVNNKTFRGYNKRKSHPLQKKFGSNDKAIYLHAEVDAIRKAYRVVGNLKGGKLYVARTTADGEIAMSCPCDACSEAIGYFDIEKTFFTTNHGFGKLL